jgi:hypothetical protein
MIFNIIIAVPVVAFAGIALANLLAWPEKRRL